MNSHDLEPDGELTDEQAKLVERLSDQEVKDIDNAILEITSERWRKVAWVVGTTMMSDAYSALGLPDIYYSQRVQQLVKNGLLESQGNLSHMRYSEVRRLQ